ncbi:DUF1839 family protein [Candidatus Woesearchaeota archaeon]|nr:DUF1839 family protein [Candidatus Woesearchaeota archaeon]
MKHQLFSLDSNTYQRHRLHTQERNWAETNCYCDVWIEFLHASGFEPIAALPFSVAIDFEGDQWTFFKFPHADLRDLYGLDVQELAIWRPLAEHVEEQISLGRAVLVELDSFYLPDTEGTSYRQEHTKSTVAAVGIDISERWLGYFHGQSYYELSGSDFVNAFRMEGPRDPSQLPPYAEFVKRRNTNGDSNPSFVGRSIELLRKQLRLVPETNPFPRFRSRFERDLEWLKTSSIEVFHQYSFATLRQCGACFELTATYLQWLKSAEVSGVERTSDWYATLATKAKSFQFQLARSMARNKPIQLEALDEMAAIWQDAVNDLKTQFL